MLFLAVPPAPGTVMAWGRGFKIYVKWTVNGQ